MRTFNHHTVEHALPPENAMSPMGFVHVASRMVSHRSVNLDKGDRH